MPEGTISVAAPTRPLTRSGRVLWWLLWILFAAMLATPLYVNSQFFFPFITSKAFVFRLLVEVAVVLYVLLAFRAPVFRPRLTLVHWAVLVYLAVQVLASLLGVNLYRSFWGNAERSEGLLTLSHLVAYLFMLSFTLRSWRDWRRLLLVSLGVSVLTGIYGLAQLTGQETLFGFIRIIGTGRIASTIGNASFFAGYLLLHLIVVAVLFVREAHPGWKIAIAAAGLFDLIILFATETRGAVLGLLVGLAVVGAWLVISVPSRKVRLFMALVALVFVLAAAFVFVNREADWVQANGMLRRLATISATDITTQSRLAAWRASWEAWRERFWLGWGYENYNVAFNKHFPGVIYRDEGSQVWFDRAHNIIFDVGVTAGLVGLVSYVSIFTAAFLALRQTKKSMMVILMAGLAAYGFQNLFVFDTLGTYLLFFAFLAFAVSGVREPVAQENSAAKAYSAGTIGFATVVVAVGMMVAAYFFNLRPALANRAVAEAGVIARSGDLTAAASAMERSLALGTYMRFEARQKFAELVQSAQRDPNLRSDLKLTLFRKAEDELKRNVAEEPRDVFHLVYLLTLYNSSDEVDPAALDRLTQVFERAIQLSPGRAALYYELGQAKMSQRKFDEGIAAFRQAVALASNVMEAHWNLGAALLVAGREAEGQIEFQKAAQLGLNLNSLRHLKRIVRVYNARRDFANLAKTYEAIVALEPSAQTYASLAAVYKELGNVTKATEAVEKAVELDGSFGPEAEAFLELLQKTKNTSGQRQGLR